ncbi:hypothetical protein NQ314_003592 [Rhamnusium bicolor]|uniref:ITG-like peptide n=1 Tax=Rhamnusium bicolor TaxID=1586634 RepID=A0AAV8ZNA8_9CUCU|nr:hypothetical protein NQ314_003592 [Rhamnusium bicolor]
MKAAVAILTLCLLGHKAHAWGGLFNRFSPEMLANMGYGGHGGSFIQRNGEGEEGIMEEYVSENNEDEPCYGKRCTANEHCCPGSVCVDVDGGSCLFAYGRRVGELCRRDSDCESGLVCAEADGGISRVCRPPVHQDKQYSEPCNMSSECDISRGLCCQLQRRHRQAPRKVTKIACFGSAP